MKFFSRWRVVAAVLIVVPAITILFKIFYYNYNIEDIIPDKGYRLTLSVRTGQPRPMAVKVRTFAPTNNAKQSVLEENSVSEAFTFKLLPEEENRVINWSSGRVSGESKIQYTATLKSHPVAYIFNEETQVGSELSPGMEKYLKDTSEIQVSSEVIRQKTLELTAGKSTLYEKIRAIHRFVYEELDYVNFSGGLDAQSALLLMEASCNGKSRLYVAMVRRLGVPSRVAGGIILNKSPKKTIHQWVEIYINGQWVPFCPTNDHFAALPGNYVTLYTGDHVLFKRTSKIDFDYDYTYERVNLPRDDLAGTFHDLPINIFAVMEHFEKFNLSLGIFIYLLMLPLAALVSVILKNVVGLETFGTFLPILMASVLGSTGVIPGLAVFFGIIFGVYFINQFISRLDLLYHPRMAILLSFVILALLSIFYAGLTFKFYNLVYVVFFPVAIIAITINRVIAMIEEESFQRLLITSINTAIVTTIAFYFIHSTFLQLLMLSFPELILVFIALNILVGRWAGFRMSEYFRFMNLFKEVKKSA